MTYSAAVIGLSSALRWDGKGFYDMPAYRLVQGKVSSRYSVSVSSENIDMLMGRWSLAGETNGVGTIDVHS